jgi:serine/threonine-protein kinase
VYAVGVLLFEMLTGAPPRRYEDWEQAQAGWRNPPEIPPLPGIPPRLSGLIAACLATDPAARPAAAEVARVASAAATDATTAAPAAYAAGSARPPAPPTIAAPRTMMMQEPPRRSRSLWPLAWLTAAVVLAIGAVLIYTALQDPSGPALTPAVDHGIGG